MIKKVLLATFLFFLLSPISVKAEGEEILDEFESVIPPESGVDLDEMKEAGGMLGVEGIFREIVSAFEGTRGAVVGFFFLVFGIAVLFSAHESCGTLGDARICGTTSSGVLMLASVSIFSALFGVCSSMKSGLVSLASFFGEVIPVISAVNVASGATSSAATQAANMNITLAFIERFSVDALLPVSLAVFSLSFIGAIGESEAVLSIGRGVKNFFTWGIGIISTVLAAVISIQSVVASATDSAILRAARYAANGTIPVVGSTVASALATLGGGMAVIKGTVGGVSIAVILALTLSPLIMLLMYRLSLSVSISLLSFSGSTGGVRCFSAIRSALDTLIAVYSMSVLVAIVELVVFIKGGAEP